MKNRTLTIHYILLFLLFSNFQCDDCKDKLHDQSSFTAGITPQQLSYNIGDTILLGTSFSALIPLERSKTTHDNANQMISFVVQVFEVKPNNEEVTNGIENFDIRSRTGQIIPSFYYDRRLAKEIVNTCDNDGCEFLIELIPKKKGIYCFSLLNSRFGEAECESLSLIGNDFGLEGNNFEICEEINTSQFRLLEGGAFYSNPEEVQRFYFFEVD